MRKGLIPLCLFASLILASCATEEVVTDVWESDYSINLNALVASSEEGSTRAGDADVTNPGTEAGETEMNENKLVTLDFFFYQLGADENADALYHLFYKPGVETTWTKNQAVTRETLKMLVGDALAANAQCNVYVVANCYEGTAASPTEKFTGTESRNTLRKTQIVSTFNENVKQDCFVMEGEALASLQQTAGGQYQLTGSISLYRSAAKARLSIMIDPEAKANGVDDANGNKWYPSTEGMKCMLVNGVKQGYVSRELSAGGQNYSFLPQATDYFPLSMTNKLDEMTTYGREMRTEKTDDDGNTWYKHDYPFYSYRTVDWKEQTNREAYMLLMVPWTRTNSSTTVTANTFYQVPMPIKSTEQEYRLKSYRYYRMEVEVGSMGSFSIEDPVLIKNNSYIVVDWGVTGTAFTADLDPVKYLAVYETSIVMDNTETKDIQFASSDDIAVVAGSVSIRRWNISNIDPSWTTVAASQVDISIDNESGIITLNHSLNNNFESSADFTQYEISFTVAHNGDDENYRETINIVQYPMLYVKDEKNSNGNATTTTNYGYVYINGYQNSNTPSTRHTGYNVNDYGGVNGLTTTSNNRNSNRYIISVSSLSTDKYVIGDPRLKYVNNDLSETGNLTTQSTGVKTWTAYANANRVTYRAYDLYANGYQNELEYYHPTEEGGTNSRTYNMISPEFMVASSYGICSNGRTREQARKRCASYQEDGYPAGRWRLPTYAEVEYIAQLSAWGVIPVLFGYMPGTPYYGNDAPYWSANGVINVNSSSGNVASTTSTQNVSVRCVYDTWYWDDKIADENKDQFYWGDTQDADYWNAQ